MSTPDKFRIVSNAAENGELGFRIEQKHWLGFWCFYAEVDTPEEATLLALHLARPAIYFEEGKIHGIQQLGKEK